MRAKFYLIILSVLASFMSHSQSLVAGDIAFIGYNTDAGPVAGQDHSFTFIALTDIPAGEIIYFTEEGWDDVSNIWAGTTEGHAQWTAPAGGVSCGTVVFVTESGADVFTVTSGTISLVSGSGWNLSGGDQVLAYYAATPEPATTPTFISGVNGDDGNGAPVSFNSTTQWNDPSTGPLGTAKSGLPAGLTNGVNCVSLFVTTFTEADNAKYTGTLTGTSTALRAAINDRTNWTFNDATAFDISPAGYSPSVTCVAPCTDPTIPSVTASANPICAGGSTTLNITGTLNDATAWHVYTGFCGVTPVGTTAGTTFTVSPTTTTSYYIRGEGGCVTPGTCGAITVTVNPADDASFGYSASSYCVNVADPTPTITGTTGGAFSSTAGLSLNSSTGTIDVSASTPGTYTVTYTTAGPCPNNSNVSVTINALDDPSFAYSAAAYCVNAPDPTPTITGQPGGSFSSSAGLSINTSTGTIDVSASTPGTYTVTYLTAGACPNSSNVSVTVNGLDNASFAYSASAYCVNAPDPTPTVTGVPGGSFTSTAGLSINGSTGTIDVSASTPGTYTVTYTTTGTCPSSSTSSVTVNGLDDPSFSYSAASYCANDADPTPTITGLAGGTFSSTAGLSINASTGQVDVSASTPGTYTVTYTTSGTCPSSSNVSLTVNALDDASFSYSAASYCVAEVDPTPTVTGLAGGSFSSTAGLSINASTGTIDVSASTPGTYTVTYTTTGACPNSASVSVTITALDDASFSYSAASYCLSAADPVATITGVGGGTFSSTAGLVFASTATGEIDLGASTPGTYTVTYATTGACANSSTQSVTITTSPTAPSVTTPIVVCSGNDVILSATGSGAGNIIFYDNTMTQLASVPMPPATATFNTGALADGTYTFMATEENGGCESSPTTIEVFVGDTTDPTAVCQDITVYLDGAGLATITASDLDGGSSDNCGAVTFSASQTSFDCSDVGGTAAGTLIITGAYDATLTGGTPKGVELYVANDIADLSQYGIGSANNGGGTDGEEFTFPAVSVTAGTYIYVASESVQFTSFFGFAPDYTDGSMGINGDDAIELFHMGSVIDVFGDINVDGTGQPWEYLDGWAYRNNGTGPDGSTFTLANWTFSGITAFNGAMTNATASPALPIGTFTPASSGSTPVTLTVTDGGGNTATCSANVTVIDSISPVISCPGDQAESLDATCSFVLPDYTGLATATDNCGTPTVTQSPAAGTTISADQVITLTAEDVNGNTTTCSFTVVVSDNTPPTAVCQNITVYLDGAGNATITASDIDGGSSDNCGPVTLSASQAAFTCADVGSNTVTLTVTDGNLNTATCTATVTVADTVAPVVVCPGNQTETASATCDFVLPDYTGLVSASDNCSSVTVTQSPAAGTTITSDQVITMTGVDANGNSSTCTFNVVLTGATPPTAVCQNITVYLDGSGNASIVAADIDGGSTATCGGLTLSASVTSFTCADLGANNVTLTATDGGGNTDDCIAVVTVLDTISPTPDAASLNDVTAECEVTSLTAPTALDNCGSVTVTNDATFPISTQGSTVVTWTYDDGNGNTATQTQTVIITDFASPIPSQAPLPDVVGECSVDALPSAPTAEDACAGLITGVLITPVSLPITTQGTTVITWEFDDGNGNIATQTQNLVVNDVTAPTPDAASLPDLTGDCSIDTPTAPTATDNCSGAITATTSTVFPITAIGTTTIVWEFDDGNGNVSTQTQEAINSGIDASASLGSDGVTITANTSGGTYAWINCDFNTTIAGETGQSFTPAANGNYAVVVTLGNCTDTSACINVNSVGLNDLSIEQLAVYPNPSLDGFFTVNYEGSIEAIDVVDMLGRTLVLPTDVSTGVVDGSELAQGRYMVRVTTNDGILTTEIVIVK